MAAKKQVVLEEIEIVKAANFNEGYYFIERGHAEPGDKVLAVVNGEDQASAVVEELSDLSDKLADALAEDKSSRSLVEDDDGDVFAVQGDDLLYEGYNAFVTGLSDKQAEALENFYSAIVVRTEEGEIVVRKSGADLLIYDTIIVCGLSQKQAELVAEAMSHDGDKSPGASDEEEDQSDNGVVFGYEDGIEFEVSADPGNAEILILDDIIEKLQPLTDHARRRIVQYVISRFAEEAGVNV